MTDEIQTIVQIIGLAAILFSVWVWRKDKLWKRTEAATELHDRLSQNRECQLAMFMIDYRGGKAYEFDYEFPKLSEKVRIRYDKNKRKSALSKPYDNLSYEEQAIRYIFDVYIDHLERVFYCFNMRYFGKNDLIFFKQWLDALQQPACEDVRTYARKNSSGLFAPFLSTYEIYYQRRIKRLTKATNR